MKWLTKYQGREYIAYGDRCTATALFTKHLGFTPDPMNVVEVFAEPQVKLIDKRVAPGS